jgi:carboxymethylenebutenolidase
MPLDTRTLTYDSHGVAVPAFRARVRTDAPLPGILLVQEIWGVDVHLEDVAGRLAMAGYDVVAPDLWAAGGARPDPLRRERIEAVKEFVARHPSAWGGGEAREQALTTVEDPERGALRETMARLFLPDAGRPERLDRYARIVYDARSLFATRYGVLGFCMGGGVAGRVACMPGPSAAVVFYGDVIPADRVAKVGCPVLGHYGEPDARITPHVPALAEAMRAAGKSFESHVYEAPHAFFNDTRLSYRVDAARVAWSRTLAFLGEHLAPA